MSDDSALNDRLETIVSDSINRVLQHHGYPTDGSWVPADPPYEMEFRIWRELLNKAAPEINREIGREVFWCSLQYAAATVGLTLAETIEDIAFRLRPKVKGIDLKR